MRAASAALPVVAVLLGACAFGADKELETHVMHIAPRNASLFECGWQKNCGSAEDKAVYDCVFGANGDLLSVGTELLAKVWRGSPSGATSLRTRNGSRSPATKGSRGS